MGEVSYEEICRELHAEGMWNVHIWLLLYASGATPRQIAANYDVHPNSVHGVLRKYTSKVPLLTKLHMSSVKLGGEVERPVPRQNFWAERLKEVIKYQVSNGVLPHPKLRDPIESRLGRWLDAQRKLASAGRLTVLQQTMLDQLGDWKVTYRQSRDEARFKERLDELRLFYSSSSRLPSYRSNNQVERKLGIWLHGRRTDVRRGRLSENRLLSLDAAIPGWRGSTRALSVV